MLFHKLPRNIQLIIPFFFIVSPIHQTPVNKPTTVPPPSQPVKTRLPASPIVGINKLRPKSLFVIPTILNDSKALSKFQDNRNPTIDVTHCSSSTIDDADSTLTSSSSTSLHYQQEKRNNLYNSLPSLTVPPTTVHIIKTTPNNQQTYNSESSSELDQISDLTSKMFGSGDEEDVPISDSNTSTSSSSIIPYNP